MRIFFVVMTSLFIMLSFTSCSKRGDQGPAGLAGPEGPAGPVGSQGPQGVTSNGNVIVYNYGLSPFVNTGVLNYSITNISKGKVDSSLILAYALIYGGGGSLDLWYPIPGVLYYAFNSINLETRYEFQQTNTSPSTYTMTVRLYNVGTTNPPPSIYSIGFSKFKIIVVPASTILAGGRQSAPPVNFSDYHAVCKYFNIPE
jgi:hypothetical protein